MSEKHFPPDEELVAYLDGELDAEQSRRIEALLASDAEVRRRVQELERTWDLLDELDATPADARFTHGTLEVVALTARQELEQALAQKTAARRMWWWRRLGGLCLAALLGFSAVAFLAPDPNRQLLQDLPLLERFDEYRPIGGVEFLELLDKAQLFSGEEGELSDKKPSFVSESLIERREYVENLTLDDKRRLLQVAERFAALTSSEQQALRQLQEYLQQSPRAEQLYALIRRYVEWWKSLPSYSRAELAELAADKRIEWIKKRLREEQAREGGRGPSTRDIEALQTWLREYLARHEAALLNTLSEPERKRFAELSPSMRQRAVFWHTWQQWQALGPNKLSLSNKDLEEVRSRLSREARQRLEAMPPERQWQTIVRWLLHGMRRPAPFSGSPERPFQPDDERLMEFFEKELSDEQRDRLLSLPGDEMHRELQRLFFLSRGGRSMEGPPRRKLLRENGERFPHQPGGAPPPWPGPPPFPAEKQEQTPPKPDKA